MANNPQSDSDTSTAVLSNPASVSTNDALIAALENAQFKWRTVDGLAKELRRPPGEIMAALQALIDQGLVIRSTVPSKTGEDLFTTRKHYTNSASTLERFFAAFRNRAS